MSARESNPSSKTTRVGVSRRRLWLFRILALCLGPLLILAALELGLRLFSYGHPTRFFLRTTINGVEYYVPNDRFGYTFFGPALARPPVDQRMAVNKPTHTFRIFLFGESAAQGDPDSTFGTGRYLQALLRERYPGTDFEIINVAMTAISSHVILPIARDCARRDGDLWIIYMGNNEMVGPFGASTVFGSRAPTLPLARAAILLKASRTGQLLNCLLQRWGARSQLPRTWTGLNMFQEHPLGIDDPNRLRAYANFKRNLADILTAARRAGVPVILSTVGSNLKDCAPFASANNAVLTASEKSQWDAFLRAGITFQSAGQYPEALKEFARAAAIDSHHAELQFRMGTCDLARTNCAAALREFEAARNDDALDVRADSRINQILKDAADARAREGVRFLDAARMLSDYSPAGIPGNELFLDHVHFNFAGNYLLGRAFAEQTALLLPPSILAHGKPEWAARDVCDARLAVSPWDCRKVLERAMAAFVVPPFIDQLNNELRTQFYTAALARLASQMNEASRKKSRALYEAALTRAPNDYFLHDNFADFLFRTGALAEAVKEAEQVAALLPQSLATHLNLGKYLVRQGRTREAKETFLGVLKRRPDFGPALDQLGLIAANEHNLPQAAKYFAKTLRINPGSVDAYINWGFAEQCDGKMDQAAAHYRQAADLQPSGPAALFSQAVDLAQKHQRDEAIACLKEAARMKPNFWQAKYQLGVELAAAGKIEEAQTQFLDVIGLRPDFEQAHVNAGVALARQGKFEGARKEFQTALQLNPADQVARQHLEAVERDSRSLKASGN